MTLCNPEIPGIPLPTTPTKIYSNIQVCSTAKDHPVVAMKQLHTAPRKPPERAEIRAGIFKLT